VNEAQRDDRAAALPAGSITEAGLIGRITALARAFRGFAERVPGLTVSVVGTLSGRSDLVHPVAGFEVGLAGAGGAAVSLYVSSSYGELRRPLKAGGQAGVLRETFQVRLSDGFEWGGSAYPDADALAHDLLGYLQYHLDTHR
jgi:hypothetical protein